MDSRNSHTTPATTSTTPIYQLLGAANANGTYCRIPSTPTTVLRERGDDTSRSTSRSGRQKSEKIRQNMRREERVSVRVRVKKQQPDRMSLRGLCKACAIHAKKLPHSAIFQTLAGNDILYPWGWLLVQNGARAPGASQGSPHLAPSSSFLCFLHGVGLLSLPSECLHFVICSNANEVVRGVTVPQSVVS